MNVNIFRWSLNTRIAIISLAIFLSGIWVLAFYTGNLLRNDMQNLLSDHQFSSVSLVAANINKVIYGRLLVLEKVAQKITPDILGNAASIQTFLENSPALDTLFNAGTFVTRIDGTSIASTSHSLGRADAGSLDRDYIIAAIKEGKATVGRPVINKQQIPVFSMAAPILDSQGVIIGALVGITNIEKPNFLNSFTDANYGKSGDYMIVAPQHRQIVITTDKKRIMELLPAPGINPFIDRAIQGFEGSGITTNPQGVQVLVSTKSIPVAGWYVAATLPTTEAFGSIESMHQRLMLAALILTLLAVGLTWWFIKNKQIDALLENQVEEQAKELRWTNRYEQFRSHVLELLAGDKSLPVILEAIVQGVERLHPEMICSILLLDREGKHLGNGVAVSLSDTFNTAIDGMEIGMGVGSCGTAAFTGERVIVDDIATHPYWAAAKKLAARNGLGSCWSQPIRSSSGRVLGTFAIYHHDACSPTEHEITLIEQSANLASIAIDKSNATETLRDSEQRFRSFVENVNDILFSLTPSGKFLYVSPQWKDVFGYEISETIGQPFLPFVHPDDVAECVEFTQHLIATGKKNNGVEFRMRRKDGTYLWYKSKASHIKDIVTGRYSLVGITRDITANKLAEKQIQDQLHFMELLIETIPLPIFYKNSSGVYSGCNNAFCNYLGRPKEMIVGHTVFDIAPTDLANIYHEADLELIRRNDKQVYESKVKSLDGLLHDVIFYKAAFTNIDGTPAGLIGTILDITERKQAEERLQQFNESLERRVFERTVALENSEKTIGKLLQTTDQGIYGIDLDGCCTFINRAAMQMLGYQLAEECVGRNMHDLIHHCYHSSGLTYPEADCALCHTMTTGLDVKITDPVLWRKDGTSFPAEYSSHTIIENGIMSGAVVTFSDVTESKKLKDQLQQSQKMEAVGQLAGGLAHDFNNVLSIINGYCSLLEMEMEQNETQKEYLDKILGASNRAGELTRSMLAFSRTQVMKSEVQNLNTVVTKVGNFVEKIIGENIQFTTIIKEANLPVYVDEGQIEQILINLSNNARDAMPHGGKLEITTESILMDASFIAAHGFGNPGRFAVITVSDTGTGMDEATTKKIFEPFFTTKDIDKGTGLGLAMVYGITKQHNGYVDVYSEPGHGARFMIYLPIIVMGSPKSDINTVVYQELWAGTETILIAEDDANVREFMNKALTRFGYQVICAVDGQDAVNTFKENADTIQLIIMDMIMPNKSGKAAYDEIKQIRPEAKALFSSGYSARIIEQQGELGSNAEFISKPVQPAEFLKKVRELLDRHV